MCHDLKHCLDCVLRLQLLLPTPALCASTWTQLPHQDDRQSVNTSWPDWALCNIGHKSALIIKTKQTNKTMTGPSSLQSRCSHNKCCGGWREPRQKTKQWCLVIVGFVKKHWGLWRSTTEVPLWQPSSLSGISRVPANPGAGGGTQTPPSACLQGTQRARGCALAKGPLIISRAQSFRDSH